VLVGGVFVEGKERGARRFLCEREAARPGVGGEKRESGAPSFRPPALTLTDSTTPKVSPLVTVAPTSGSSTYTTSPSSSCGWCCCGRGGEDGGGRQSRLVGGGARSGSAAPAATMS